jgi:hypothetical protein
LCCTLRCTCSHLLQLVIDQVCEALASNHVPDMRSSRQVLQHAGAAGLEQHDHVQQRAQRHSVASATDICQFLHTFVHHLLHKTGLLFRNFDFDGVWARATDGRLVCSFQLAGISSLEPPGCDPAELSPEPLRSPLDVVSDVSGSDSSSDGAAPAAECGQTVPTVPCYGAELQGC